MVIVMWNGRVIECFWIEPCRLKPGYILVDEDYTIALEDILYIKAGGSK